MTTITSITGNITATDTRSGSDVLYLVSAIYATGSSNALNIASGSNVEVVFRNGGSVFNTYGFGTGVDANTDIHLTVEDGSSLSCAGIAVNMQSGHVLNLTNLGTLVGTAGGAIMGAGNGSSITNYGEIRGAGGYFSTGDAGSTVNNYGTISATNANVSALDLGDGADTINNYGTVYGKTALYGGADYVFNSGTMRGSTAILGTFGNKTIVNYGLIATIGGSDAISLSTGGSSITNLGQIIGNVVFAGGSNTFDNQGGGTVTGGVFGGSATDGLYGGAGIDKLIGGAGNDVLAGRGGDDLLDGGIGDDYMTGGPGNDRFTVDSGLDVVFEKPGDGFDTVVAAIDYALQPGVEVENLTAGVTAGMTLTGNEFSQTIVGKWNNDTLDGGGGADILIGGDGNDTYVLGVEATGVDSVIDSAGIDTITSAITRSLAAYASIENLTLLGVSAADGTGNDLANLITGNAAANVLDGGGGADTLVGGDGNDTYVLGAEATGVDSIADSSGIDTITSDITRSLASYASIENLTLSGSAAINGTGNGVANLITGNAAANVLDGGGGADTLIGGDGNDTYVLGAEAAGVDSIADSSGIDTITSDMTRSLASYASIENLTLTGAAASNGTGNGLANVITGNAAANILDGGAANDTLNAGAGNDTLIGGAGIDHLTGGAGKDFFVFNAPLSAANHDVIADFNHVADTFRLENAVMKALGATGPLKASYFFAGAAAHDADDHIIYNRANGNLFYDSNGNHAGGITLLATLTNKPALLANDFVVI